MSSNKILEVIKKRRSIRAFTAEQVQDEDLQAVLEAGMYAPSAANQQAWHFTVIQNKEVLDRLNHDAKEAGKQSDNEYIRKIVNNEKFNIF
ncbi:MAG: nitroreductase family protein, partial [Sporomusaceae bacterium]|nr:nitroreductase family protein [Sporomusaceae bacterium]